MTSRQVSTGQFAFATPVGWFPIHLPGSPAEAGRLAHDIEAGRPELASQHAALEQMLVGLVTATALVHAVGAYGILLDVSGVWMPATVLVSVEPMSGSSLEEIGREISGADKASASEMRVFDLPSGRTIRIERLAELTDGTRGRRAVSLTVIYVTEVPGRGNVVMLTFGTPAIALIDELRPVFHQIACSLLINPEGQVQPPMGGAPLDNTYMLRPTDRAEAQ